LVTGACFSEFGTEVVCVDNNPDKIAALRSKVVPIYEPGLQDLVVRNTDAGRLAFSADLAEAIQGADAVFLAVGTPSLRGDGFADLSYVYAAARQVAAALTGYTVLVTKSTVPVGTSRQVERIVREVNPAASFDVASNPEFLREGSAIDDFMRPDRIVVGTASPRAQDVLRRLYRPLSLREVPIVFTGLESAELAKYASNAFLATKITFINEMADLCERVGADVQDVARSMGMDKRISPYFLHPGPGFGGSCFPKDTLALLRISEEAGALSRIVEAVVAVNAARKHAMAERVIAACGGSVSGKSIAALGLTFKPNTDDMREAPSLEIVPALQQAGAHVRVHDPKGMAEARKFLTGVMWCEHPYDTMQDASALVLMTEWPEYRNLDLARVGKLLKDPVVVDLRNMYVPDEMAAAGLRYTGIGRGHSAVPSRSRG
jgi:UDPglucose 6-dehydrogenase